MFTPIKIIIDKEKTEALRLMSNAFAAGNKELYRCEKYCFFGFLAGLLKTDNLSVEDYRKEYEKFLAECREQFNSVV